MTNTKISIMRIKDVEKKIGLKRSTIYELMESGDFPQSLKMGARAVGWVESEIDRWLHLRVERRDEAIRLIGCAI